MRPATVNAGYGKNGKNGEESEIAGFTAVVVIRLTAGETPGVCAAAFP